MDPAQLEQIQLHNLNSSPSSSPTSPHGDAVVHFGDAPKASEPPRSDAHHVDVSYFDPSGVNELRRTMSQMSSSRKSNHGHSALPQDVKKNRTSDDASDLTLTPGDGPFDFEKTLKHVVRRIDESDIKRRELGVVFEGLRVVGQAASSSFQPTLGSEMNPFKIVEIIRNIRHPAVRDILSGFEGCVRPGEMLLVLGRPGAGCSSLLRTLANQRSDFHAVLGDVRYDCFTPEEIHKRYRGDVQYSPEDDVHFPTLTVKQTLDFAAKLRTPHSRLGESREEYIEAVTNVVTTIFGLRHVKDTLVGDASVRGVSGGEKKRVSISEVMASRSLLTSWDNSTRGLDASTALEFVRALRLATDIGRSSTIVSIYQAGESLYTLFDKVCVIYEGKMAYFGPADRAREYFINLGFEPANRQTTADFVVAVTDPNGRIVREGYEARAPRTADEFAQRFLESEMGARNRADIEAYKEESARTPEKALEYRESHRAEHAKTTPPSSSFITSIPMQARALMLRRIQIIQGAKGAQIMQTGSFILQAVIVGTIFLRLEDSTAAYFSRGGVLFFALLFAALSTMSEIPALFVQRPIVLRQSRAAMYRPFVDSLALTLVDMPMTGVTLIFFSIVLYFTVGLQQSAGQFFIFLLFVYSMTLTMKAWFRGLAAAFQNAAPAQAVAGVSVLILTLYTGYNIPQPYMIGALRWITYINPLKYGFEAMVLNEFHTLDGACASLIPQGPGYENITLANQVCTTVGSLPGQAFVNGMRYVNLSFEYYYKDLWRNFGIVVAFGIGFICAYLAATEINTSSSGQSSVTLFKRGSKPIRPSAIAVDEERRSGSDSSTVQKDGQDQDEARKAMAEASSPKNTFSFQNLTYVVPVKDGQRKLLDGVSGYVAPGKLTALMGESGAGKTTLLNVLSERTAGGVVTGDRLMNGQRLPVDFRAQTGYVQQMDTHLPTATVREALLFSAKLRQPASVSLAEKEAYVDKCLRMCGLEEYAEAIVGSLSVEHRKRTTIGVELVAKPSLIFLDEPTSGLDSQSAWAIVCFLRTLADSGQSIVCTIHQPSAELFEQFDRLLLLRKGGQIVYFGDLGHKSMTLINYFQSNGARTCDDSENPAEYILDVIGAGATASTDVDWHQMWDKSQNAVNLVSELDAIHAEGRQRPKTEAAQASEFATSWGYQLVALLQRNFEALWRNPPYLIAKLGVNIAAGLLIGFTFFKAKDSIQGTQNKLFAIFMSTIISVPLSNQLQVPFLDTRAIYEIRERHSNMYSWTALITSQLLVEIPWNIFGSSLYFICWYWTVGFPSDRGGFTYFMLGVLSPLYYTSIGQAVAAMCPNAEIAALLFSFLFSFVLSFNGVLQPFRLLGWWRWMYRLSPYTYLIEALLGQAIGHSKITCAAVELVNLDPPSGQTCQQYLGPFIETSGGYLTNGEATSNCEYCAYSTTDAFLEESFNIVYAHHWRDFGIFCAFIIFNIVCVYLLTYLFRIRTGSLAGSLIGWFKRFVARRRS
ncbi:hypothetical protein POSPLADRAFT_1074039 [Postia placenta MAD-698-R-SB12]|uniref:ABC transporter domain-containing protein n=1 Tax=Postia placenta MAD-698-R-SB12 TaxID=670580 RepID=A0A1X6N4A3_9APHY|nr:hypothetical protein POSPLADRAFT_1074039 [Postia placenta MAD-698-R-SB12]OSX63435.1 hypothetical protein POSPLADRAFT_1074039 [Postia placenta MAD-698-R-SB12]